MRRKLIYALLLLAIITLAPAARFPEFSLRSSRGETVTLDSLLSLGKPLVIVFWATWCKPCNKQLVSIRTYIEDLHNNPGFITIAICEDDPRSIRYARGTAKKEGWDHLLILYDEAGALSDRAGVIDIPELFIVNTEGKVLYRHIGFNPGDEKIIHEKIEQVINQGKGSHTASVSVGVIGNE